MGGLQSDWLAAELADTSNVIDGWSPEFRASFASLFENQESEVDIKADGIADEQLILI